MSIYSANRTGSMNTASFVANESYGSSDLGRILYESHCNDMALFEAMVVTDLKSMAAVSEGTMLLSEAEEGDKKSFSQIIAFLKDKIAKWWEKLKGAFKSAIRKISAYILGDNKAFVKNFEEVYNKKVGKGKSFTGEIKTMIYNVDALKGTIPTYETIRSEVEASKTGDAVDKQALVCKIMSDALGEKVEGAKDYRDRAFKKYGTEMGCSSKDLYLYKNILTNASESIKSLRDLEKYINDKVSNILSVLTKAEKEAKRVDGEKDHSANVRNLTATAAAFENVVGVMTSVGIGMVKANVKNSRVALRKVLSQMNGDEATVAHEAAVVDADDAENALTDAPVEAPMDAETAAAVDEVIAATDAE